MSGEVNTCEWIFIKATPEQVWVALTAPEFTTRYFPGGSLTSDWQPGSDYARTSPDGAVLYEGKVLESNRPRRLVQTVNFREPRFAGHQEMTIEWDIEQFGEACKVKISHRGSESDTKVIETLTSYCPTMLSGMKTLLETGQPLHIAEPLASAASA